MATRMQQRRGTASQWTTANPVLATGEIGFETDTNQFKMGDGTNHWADLSYFKNLDDLGGSLDDYVLIADLGAPGSAASLDVNGYIPVNQLGNILGEAPQILDTLEELAGALQDADGLVTIKINTKADEERIVTTSDINTAVQAEQEARDVAIAGYVDSAVTQARADVTSEIGDAIGEEVLARDNAISDAIAGEVTNRNNAITSAISDEVTNRGNAITTAIGDEVLDRDNAIADSASAVTGTLQTYADNAASSAQTAAETSAQGYVDTHNSDTTNVHGITDTANLVYTSDLTSGLAGKQDVVSGVSATEIGYLDGVTSAIQTQIDGKANSSHNHSQSDITDLATDLAAKAPLANPTFTGTVNAADVTISGNLTVEGTTTTVNATDLVVTDPLIYIGEGNSANLVDLGLVSSFNDGTYQHAGIVRDASAGTWKIFKGVTDEPTTTINFTQGSLDDLAVNNLTAAGVVFTDGTQVKQGVPSLTAINQQAGAYTVTLTDRDKLVEVNSASGVTVTIPTDASVAYPVGTSIDILQTGSGQVTIAAATPGTTTVNATPGLKLRTQWSSATLFKRAANTWVVFGDLSA